MPGGAPGSIYADPNTASLYSPQGPGQTFGPADVGYPQAMMAQDMGMLPQNGMVQPGELQNLNYNQSLGQFGNVQMYGDPNGEGGVGGNYRATPPSWLHIRDLQVGAYTNDEQFLITGGTTMEFFVNDSFGLGGRALIGSATNDHLTDEYSFNGDLYMGTTALDEHWIKGGVIYDVQDNFHKYGPALGMLLFADRRHPINVDAAYGLGYGDPVVNRSNSTLTTVADDDMQLRAGTYITPNLQAGFSGNWLNWADSRFTDYNGYGGYINLNLGTLAINVDYTTGDGRDRGFVNVAYTFGGRRSRATDGCDLAYVEHPRDWLGKPVMRDVSLQLQRVGVTNLPPLPGSPTAPINQGVGNVTQVQGIVAFPRTETIDLNGNGIVDPGDQFELDFIFTNNTQNVATNVSFGTNVTVLGPGFQAGGVGAFVGNVPPGTTLRTNDLDDACIAVDSTAVPGQQIFVDFDVTSDGQTRRFRVGPFIVGQTTQTNIPVNATPL